MFNIHILNLKSDFSKSVIFKRIHRIYCIPDTYISAEDAWQDFLATGKLPKAIVNFDRSYGEFISLLRTYLHNYCIDINRKYYGRPNEDHAPNPTAGKIKPSDVDSINKKIDEGWDIPDSLSLLNNGVAESLKIVINYLNNFRNNEENKLIFYVNILDEIIRYDDIYVLLKEWRGKSLEEVCNMIEMALTETLYPGESQIKTKYVQKLKNDITKKGLSSDIFLEKIDVETPRGKQTINERIYSIRKIFRKKKKEIIDNIKEGNN